MATRPEMTLSTALSLEASKLAGAMSVPPMAVGSGAASVIGGALFSTTISAIVFFPNVAVYGLSDIPPTPGWLWSAPTTGQAPKPSTSRRSRELHFREVRQDLFKALSGQWVCVEGESIVAHGSDVAGVVAEARRKGVQVPYIFRVSSEPEGSVRMGL